MKTTAIVLAAGSGSRMKSNVRKQYMEIMGKPLLLYSLEEFENSFIDEIILVLPAEDIQHIKENIIEPAGFSKIKAVVSGGSTRYHSVRFGLEAASEDTEAVFIHAGARPFVSGDILDRALNAVKEFGACVVGMPVKDTIKLSDENGFAETTVDRARNWMIQTPQTFLYPEILDLYEELARRESELLDRGINITDDAMLVEKMGHVVVMFKGAKENIKITDQSDIMLCKAIIESRKNK